MALQTLTQALIPAGMPLWPFSYSAGTYSTGSVDMSNFARVIFFLEMGGFAASGTITLKLQISTDQIDWVDLISLRPSYLNTTTSTYVQAQGNNKLASLEMPSNLMPSGYSYLRATAVTETNGISNNTFAVIPMGSLNWEDTVMPPSDDIFAVKQRLLVIDPIVSYSNVYGLVGKSKTLFKGSGPRRGY